MQPKLSKTQQELLDALRSGLEVQYAPSFAQAPAYYFIRHRGGKCTAAAQALLDKGIVEKYDMHKPRFGAYRLRVKP